MDPRQNRIVLFSVTDACNMRCRGCHWFSAPVKPRRGRLAPEDITAFLARTGPYDRAVFAGGEPTLWQGLAQAVNGTPLETEVAIYTNGSSPETLTPINRSNVYLRLSVHEETMWISFRATLELAKERGWRVKLFSYETDFARARPPKWLDLSIKVTPDQIEEGDRLLGHLLNTRVRCRPRMLFIGSDGRAYTCEKGMRAKDDSLAEDFDLWSGDPHVFQRECTADRACLSCMMTEQFVEAPGKPLPPSLQEPTPDLVRRS